MLSKGPYEAFRSGFAQSLACSVKVQLGFPRGLLIDERRNSDFRAH
jgi:hypothetical protein